MREGGRRLLAFSLFLLQQEDFKFIEDAYRGGSGDYVVYTVRVGESCRRCRPGCIDQLVGLLAADCFSFCGRAGHAHHVQLPTESFAALHRLMDTAATTKSGPDPRVHANFVYHLQHQAMSEKLKAAYFAVIPQVYMMYHVDCKVYSRKPSSPAGDRQELRFIRNARRRRILRSSFASTRESSSTR